MSRKNSHHNIDTLKDKIINNGLLIGSIMGGFAYLISLFNYQTSQFRATYLTDLLVVISFIIVYKFRQEIRIEYKSLLIILGLVILILTDTLKLGLYSDSKILLVIIPFFSFLVYSIRKTLVIYLLILLGYLVVGYLFVIGKINSDVDYYERSKLLPPWLINVILVSIVSFIIVIIVKQFYNTFLQLISDLKSKNLKIAQSEKSYREIFNSSSDAIFVLNLEGEILEVNDAMLNMYGYTRNDFTQLSFAILSAEKDDYTIKNAVIHLNDAIEKNRKTFEWQAKKKNGKFFWIEVVLKKTIINDHTRILAIIRDINEKKKYSIQLEKYKKQLETDVKERTEQLEQTNKKLINANEELVAQSGEMKITLEVLQETQKQLIQSEKMASLGIMAAGVAHEINNPLNFIQGGINGIANFFEENNKYKTEDITFLIDAIQKGTSRAAAIVTSLNHFSRKDDFEKEDCNIHNIIDNCLVILQSKIKNRITVEKDYWKEDLVVNGNDGKLHQAMLNILTNAQDAIKENGVIKIKTEIHDNRGYIRIEDNGIGIDSDILNKITEPFFTTKEVGKGTGLGLSITYNILQEHFGTLEYNSKINDHTTAKITLPLIKTT